MGRVLLVPLNPLQMPWLETRQKLGRHTLPVCSRITHLETVTVAVFLMAQTLVTISLRGTGGMWYLNAILMAVDWFRIGRI